MSNLQVDKNDYYKRLAIVSVNKMVMSSTSKCYKCKEKLQELTVFLGEGQRLSTLFGCCCGECLPIMVNEAIVEGKKYAEEQIKRAEDRLYKESLDLIRKTQLKNLEDIK